MDLCEAAERNQGARVGMWWWEKAVIDLTGAREMEEAAYKADKDDLEE